MFYKTEMHCHTKEASACATADYKITAEKYIAAGYTTLILTNHYSADTMWLFDRTKDYSEFTERYIDAYHKLRDYAGDRLNVLLGAEVRFRGKDTSDFLAYGITEDFLRENQMIIESNLSDFHEIMKQNGFLVFQAHPFRFGITLANPKYLDGIEVFNADGGGGECHNDLADTWANHHMLLKSSGTDYHCPEHEPLGGIVTEVPIKTNEQLVTILKTENYALIKSEDPLNTAAPTK